MKKLINVVLLLSLVFSLVSGVSISAFAAEEPAEILESVEILMANAAEISAADEAEEAPADEAEEAPADEAEEVPADEAEEAPADEAEEAPADEAEEAPADEIEEAITVIQTAITVNSGDWTKATAFADGQSYVIGVENSDGTLTVLENNGGNVVATVIASPADATENMIWAATYAERGYLISNNGTNFYYKNSSGSWATTETKANWNYDGTLNYVGSATNYMTIIEGVIGVVENDANAASQFVIYTGGGSAPVAPPEDTETETDPEPPADEGGSWAEDSALTAGKTYIIGLKNADGTVSVLKDDGGTVAVASIAGIGEADESMQWLAAEGTTNNDIVYVSLENVASTGDYFYYGEGLIRNDAARNWTYADGVLSYDKAGTPYYLTMTAEAASAGTDSAAASTDIVVWSMGEGSVSDGDDETDTEADSGFTQTTKIAGLGSGYTSALFVDENGYPLFISDSGVPSCDSMALTMTGEAGSYQIDTDKPNIIWTVSEGNPPYLKLALNDKDTVKYLYIDDEGNVQSSTEDGYAFWNNGDGVNLSYQSASGTTYYIATMTSDGITTTTDAGSALLIYTLTGTATSGDGAPPDSSAAVDEEAPVITKQPEALSYVHEGSGYAAPTLTIAAQLAEGVTANNIYFLWYVEGEPVGEAEKIPVNEDGSPVEHTITLDSLVDQPAGVYNIYCEVSCNVRDEETGEPVPHTATSTNVSFTVCKGVLQNSFLTFSDVHEKFTNVGGAIQDCISVNNGLVPALIICTGDWANAYYAGGDADSENYATTMSQYISKLYAQVSGIDIVFLAGNHDNTAAAVDATIAAGLGAADDYNGIGVMFDGSTVTEGTSAANRGLVVFGINYESLAMEDGSNSYDPVLPELEAFLSALEADYRGELVVISSHTGLHQLADWAGDGGYNVDSSNKVVALLNEYADTMDIMFFFGHDHSRQETELFYKPGDPITSTVSFTDKTTETQTLGFSYGHAGYIGTHAGSQERYSLVTWDGETITRTMSVVNGNAIAELTYTLARVAELVDEPVIPDAPEIPDEPAIPDEPGDAPEIPDEPGDAPEIPDEPGDAPEIPDEPGDAPEIPDEPGDAPEIPDEPGDAPEIPDEPGDAPEIPDEPGDAPEIPDEPGDSDKPDSDKGSSGKNEKAPKTGDDANIVLWIAVLVLCAGCLAILPRKKHN